jgi:hypothetical protein
VYGGESLRMIEAAMNRLYMLSMLQQRELALMSNKFWRTLPFMG